MKFPKTRLTSVLAVAVAIGLVVPAIAGTVFDGAYRGPSKVVAGGESLCGKDFVVAKTVRNGSFDYNWNPRDSGVLVVSIADDGKVSGRKDYSAKMRVEASGMATQAGLEIDLVGLECKRHLSLKRQR